MRKKEWPVPQRIVVRGVNWLGDAVMTMPALRRVREAYPDAHIAVLTTPKLASLYECQPAIDAVLLLPDDEPLGALSARLRHARFDTALILPHSARTVFPFWLAGIPRRVGYGARGRAAFLTQPVRPPFEIKIHRRSEAEIRRLTANSTVSHGMGTVEKAEYDGKIALLPPPNANPAPSMPPSIHSRDASLYSDTPPVHHLHHYLYLAGALGASPEPCAPGLVVPPLDREAARQRFCLPAPLIGLPLIGLIPGAEYGLAKRWPPERFIAAAVELRKRLHCGFVIVGGKADAELAGRVAEGIERQSEAETSGTPPGEQKWVWNLTAQTSLKELCAVLHLCAAVVGNDTGPMHVAAAVGSPVVVPFGSTSPQLTGPGLPNDPRHRLVQAHVPCAPCFQRVCPIDFRCMNSIGVAQIVEAVLSLPLVAK